jgi:hypothetical protein
MMSAPLTRAIVKEAAAESTGDSDTRLDLGRVPVRLLRIGQVLTCP